MIKEVIYLIVDEELDYVIVFVVILMDEYGLFIESRVIVRCNGEIGIYDVNEIIVMDVSLK